MNSSLIVLHLTKVGDGSVVLHTLSREYGRRSFIVSVGKGRLMTLFQPLNILEAEIQENKKSSLWRLRNPEASCPLTGIRSDMRKGTVTMFLAEVLLKVLKEDAQEDGLFDWCQSQVLALDALQGDFANFHLRFLLDLCAALGFAPQLEDLLPFLDAGTIPAVKSLLEGSFAESMLVPLTGDRRSRIASGLLKYISYHIDSPLNVKSLEIISSLYK